MKNNISYTLAKARAIMTSYEHARVNAANAWTRVCKARNQEEDTKYRELGYRFSDLTEKYEKKLFRVFKNFYFWEVHGLLNRPQKREVILLRNRYNQALLHQMVGSLNHKEK